MSPLENNVFLGRGENTLSFRLGGNERTETGAMEPVVDVCLVLVWVL